jgi:glycosyltransferase involved in cell wall biosynthesis
MNKVLILVLNSFTNDSRVLRQTYAFSQAGYRPTVFALHESDLPIQEDHPNYRLRRFRLLTRPWSKHNLIQLIKYAECVFRMTLAGVRLKPEAIHANDINALPIGYFVAKLTRAKLVYDSHELWSDPAHRRSLRPWIFDVGVRMEKYLARRADAVMTPSPSYANQMAKTMDIALPIVVRNVPMARSLDSPLDGRESLHEKLGIAHDAPIVLHLGQIGRGRGLETIFLAMAEVRAPAVLVLLGGGQPKDFTLLKIQARTLGITDRICFLAPVAPDEVCRLCTDATIGVTMIESICMSYNLTLPNKIFEYLQAGLPVVVSDIPEMAGIVKNYNVGETVPEGNASELGQTLNRLLDSPDTLAHYRENAVSAARQLNWEKEQHVFLNVYQTLGTKTQNRRPCPRDPKLLLIDDAQGRTHENPFQQ